MTLSERDLHFHDLRGAAATKFCKAGLSERVIAEIMGWEKQRVSRIIRRYVGRAAAARAAIEKIAKGRTRTEPVIPAAKPPLERTGGPHLTH